MCAQPDPPPLTRRRLEQVRTLCSRMSAVDWSKVKTAVFSPESSNTPTKLRIDQVPLYIQGMSGDRIEYIAHGSDKVVSTDKKNLLAVADDYQPIDRSKYAAMQKKFKLKPSDIFKTPSVFFLYMSAMLGYHDSRLLFDPCPDHDAGYDGLAIPWKSPAFMNPPFSRTYEWLAKAVQEALAGVEVICLISAPNYFCVEGVTRCTFWEQLFLKCHVELLSHDRRITGTVQKWFKWGVSPFSLTPDGPA